MDEITRRPKINNPILIGFLAVTTTMGLLVAWNALAEWGRTIAAIYAVSAISGGIALLSLVIVRVCHEISLSKLKHEKGQIEIITKADLYQATAMAQATQLAATADKAKRESELFTIIAGRDEQILISDGDSSRKFTAAHLQLSGQVNGQPTVATPEQAAAWAAWHGLRSQAGVLPLPAAEPIAAAELPPIIPALANRQRILIVGASDAGKTTLLRWLIESRGKCLVIDPQGSPEKWGTAMMLGEGLNYSRISVILDQLGREMVRRYKEIGSGAALEGQYESLTIVLDDLRGIIMNCKDAGKKLAHMLTDGRSSGISLVIGTHSKFVESLGLKGEGELRKGFAIVDLLGGNGEEAYTATVEINMSGTKIPHKLPGPHPVIEEMKTKAAAAKKIETNLESILSLKDKREPTPKDKRASAIRQMYNEQGKSKTEIAQALGYQSNEGAIFYAIKNALKDTTTTTTA